MNIEEIKDAALNGKTFTIKNVPIESIEFGNIQYCIDGIGEPVLFKTVNIKFVSPDIINAVYTETMDYPHIEVCEQPKHDPTRPFKKGDVVRIRKVNGNLPKCRYNGITAKEGTIGTITSDGERNCYWVKLSINTSWCWDCAYFELVTPCGRI